MECIPKRNTNLSDSDNNESAENATRVGSQGPNWEEIRSRGKHWRGGKKKPEKKFFAVE